MIIEKAIAESGFFNDHRYNLIFFNHALGCVYFEAQNIFCEKYRNKFILLILVF